MRVFQITAATAVLLASYTFGQVQGNARASTSGACSVAHSGNNDSITINIKNCGIGEQQGKQIVHLLDQLLKNQTDLSELIETVDKMSTSQKELLANGSPTHGELLPSNEPDPPIPPSCKIPPNALKVFLGNTVVYSDAPFVNAFVTKRHNYVSILKDGSPGITINALSTDYASGKVVVKIEQNNFVANQNNTLEGRLSTDHTKLEVIDEYNQIALSVRYLNPTSIRIAGHFSADSGPMTIEESRILFGNNNETSGDCVQAGIGAGITF